MAGFDAGGQFGAMSVLDAFAAIAMTPDIVAHGIAMPIDAFSDAVDAVGDGIATIFG